ncbi:TPA: glycosyltransferase family 2 protein [Campylobacter jejuni]|nr:glycosyltransferase family 2 protein [Campylobacter jejuni]EAH5201024.1 glycosyltransferase family 2 protein [Campylobacter jejuni]EAH6052237.1 glycosyltransferase family 2 protein [Campylobacter jejuni]EAH7014149.1 glycosyltransferase family 2 protein [Campylobacter jejuni]EAH7567640.1 glycosyltransferase family 2 protein [Campylobacter jejuni]EAI1769960.1 glycosyltransferase family 2 protein [Campylobacter jejuni]
MKKVGVVIPIYNVEKYLKECLDSVINQTYTNLEIILVNDGSTDENSLNIAKEYTLKDKRIILFDKKNGGLSSARNVGIEYFSGEHKLKNKTQTIKENSLIEFNIEGNNPYEIYTVYKSYKAFNNEQDLTNFTYPIIDYIIFLDSDDYWELNCIEECVPRMDGVDVVWFDSIEYHDIEKSYFKHHSRLKDINIKKECRINPIEWLKLLRQNKIKDFAFAWSGIIDFDYIKDKKMKFKDAIFAEDHLFGILLFSQAKNIYVYPKVFYYYRIRANSLTNQDKKITKDNILPYFKDIFIAFEENATLAKEYFKYVSWVETSLELVRFVENYHDKKISSLLKDTILYFYIKNAFKIKKFDKDPLCIKEKLQLLKPYKISKIRYKVMKFLISLRN